MNDAELESNRADCAPWPLSRIPPPEWDALIPFAVPSAASPEVAGTADGVQKLDFGALCQPVRRIVALKLDHYGDFVISMPALRALREAFPHAVIRLVCGSWNEPNALASGLVDEVRSYNFFPERPVPGAVLEPAPLWAFDQAVEGTHDIAIDLRVDEDTRHLLARINARLRCGIGSVFQFPLLDIALPHEHAMRAVVSTPHDRFVYFPPERFNSSLPTKEPLHQYGPLLAGNIVHGPYTELPLGRLRAEIGLTVRGHIPGPWSTAILFEIVCDGGRIIDRQIFGRKAVFRLRHRPVIFEFDNPTQGSRFEFRITVLGQPVRGTVQFSGVTVYQLEAPPTARYRQAELHIGEKLSLLVHLVRERTGDLYAPLAGRPEPRQEANSSKRLRIAIAPFSNSTVRNWPTSYYASLISLLLERLPCEVILLGTSAQRATVPEITNAVQSPLLIDMVGHTSWDELQTVLRTADLVICNNSGTAHQAAALGSRVLAIYSGSHQPREWGPRGVRAQAIMRIVPCSPCGFEELGQCTEGHACMRQMTPGYVLECAEMALAS